MKQVWQAIDGSIHQSQYEAEKHDKAFSSKEEKELDKFLNSYSMKTLLETHNLKDYGTWMVYGEDPNCDYGGHHHKPYLGTYSGILLDVAKKAVTLPSFWRWW